MIETLLLLIAVVLLGVATWATAGVAKTLPAGLFCWALSQLLPHLVGGLR